MSKCREVFLSRLSVLRNCLGEVNLADGSPSDTQKNEIAVMLRSGLAVLSFAITEAFIRERTAEILCSFNKSRVKFNDFSDKLQLAVTVDALKGVLFRSKFEDKSSRTNWILSNLLPIAQAENDVSTLSAYSFGYSKPNLDEENFKTVFVAFQIDGGWASILEIAKRVGLGGVLDYRQSFIDLSTRRHQAAHDATTRIPLTDLNDSVKAILGICSAFDILLSHSLAMHNLGQSKAIVSFPIRPQQIKLRFIAPDPKRAGRYLEMKESESSQPKQSLVRRTVRIHDSRAEAEKAAISKCKRYKAQLVVLDSTGAPESWSPY